MKQIKIDVLRGECMETYPTIRQVSFIEDLYCSIKLMVFDMANVECDEVIIESRKKFNEITTNSEVGELIESLTLLNWFLGKYHKSVKQKHIESFKHLSTLREYFLEKHKFKELYEFVSEFLVLPDFWEVDETITKNIKNDETDIQLYFPYLCNAFEFQVLLEYYMGYIRHEEDKTYRQLALEFFEMPTTVVDGGIDFSDMLDDVADFIKKHKGN